MRARVVIVPTRAAAEHLVRGIERRALSGGGAQLLPDIVTARELVVHLAQRLPAGARVLTPAEREVLLGAACRAAAAAGCEPPFRLRPGLVAEVLRFYDTLRRQQRDVDTFERLALGMLEPGADLDRGAARLVQQTHFLAAAFREFERRVADAGADEHQLRDRLRMEPTQPPWRHIVVAVGDRAFDPHGLPSADWDLLARMPGLERLDVVTTDTALAGASHERIHQLLPGIEEMRAEDGGPAPAPSLLVPTDETFVHVARDREDEVAGFARWAKGLVRSGTCAIDQVALVVDAPLPYLYLSREVLHAGGIPAQMFDALPLAAEPYAAAVDLVLAFASSGFARTPASALLRSPHFRFVDEDERPLSREDIAALDARLAEAGFLGDIEGLEALLGRWRAEPAARAADRAAVRAGSVVLTLARELVALRGEAPASQHLGVLAGFLARHHAEWADPELASRQRRARGAVQAMLVGLREAFARFDPAAVTFDDVSALVRRWIESHTFAPRTGDGGVHVVDADSARFGDFAAIQLAGVVEGEWPARPRRNIFYGAEVLRELGWPAESDRRDAVAARFAELVHLPASYVRVSVFSLEADALVTPSPLLTTLEGMGLPTLHQDGSRTLIFEHEALMLERAQTEFLPPAARVWAERRVHDASRLVAPAFRGTTEGYRAAAYAVSALERYQDCPFRFFAANVLRLEEAPEDQSTLSPRRRGQLLHAILHRFFEAWDRQRRGAITVETLDAARALFADVAEPLLAELPGSEAALERTRLFGSPISLGVVDTVLDLEIARGGDVEGRLLEYRLEGRFSLGDPDGRSVALRGVADRIDLLAGRRLRVVDYKSGALPSRARALQAAVYALCAQERLSASDGRAWQIQEAGYVGLAGRHAVLPVVSASDDDHERAGILAEARTRLHDTVSAIENGRFAPRPAEETLCRTCAYGTVCRKEYVRDE